MGLTEKIKEDIRSKRKSVVQIYYDATSGDALDALGERQQMQPVQSRGYKDIEIVVGDINLMQREFDRIRNRADSKGMKKMFYHSYDMIAEKAGMKRQYYSDLELFEKQINNVGKLNQILASITMSCSGEMGVMQKRVNSLIDDEESSYRRINEIKDKLPEIVANFEKEKERFASMDRTDEKYFTTQRKLLDMERHLDSSQGEYVGILQTNIGVTRHKDNMIYMEKLFRISLNTAANLAVITKQIGETLVDNQRIYSNCDNIFKASAAVSGGLDILSDYNRQIGQIFIHGIGDMQDLIYNKDNVNMIEESNYNLRTLIDDVKSVGYKKDMQTESILE